MRLSDFDFNLPQALIAQIPKRPRDAARLLVIPKKGEFEHRHFRDITDYLEPGDLLIVNDSKVIPARLAAKKVSGGSVEIFLVRRLGSKDERWECLIKGKRLKAGEELIISPSLRGRLEEKHEATWIVSFMASKREFEKLIARYGAIPLPPYIASRGKKADAGSYQTVYASDTKKGSVAAPTAGLHFTPRLLENLKRSRISFKHITLHVGLGTFLPVRVEDPKKHRMHAEWVEVGADVLKAIAETKQRGNKVIAVGTTTVRSLEAAVRASKTKAFKGFVDIFIYPPFEFRAVDAMITNFHLPKSTLLMLVSAFAGRKRILEAYSEAVKKKYRFYSYGDAMLLM